MCALEAVLEDEGELFKFSKGISSFLTRGLQSRDFGVPPECERFLDPSRDDGVFMGALDVFEELLRRDEDSLKRNNLYNCSEYSANV